MIEDVEVQLKSIQGMAKKLGQSPLPVDADINQLRIQCIHEGANKIRSLVASYETKEVNDAGTS